MPSKSAKIKWTKDHPEYYKEYRKKYYEKNKKKENERGKKYYLEHKQEINKKHEAYRRKQGIKPEEPGGSFSQIFIKKVRYYKARV